MEPIIEVDNQKMVVSYFKEHVRDFKKSMFLAQREEQCYRKKCAEDFYIKKQKKYELDPDCYINLKELQEGYRRLQREGNTELNLTGYSYTAISSEGVTLNYKGKNFPVMMTLLSFMFLLGMASGGITHSMQCNGVYLTTHKEHMGADDDLKNCCKIAKFMVPPKMQFHIVEFNEKVSVIFYNTSLILDAPNASVRRNCRRILNKTLEIMNMHKQFPVGKAQPKPETKEDISHEQVGQEEQIPTVAKVAVLAAEDPKTDEKITGYKWDLKCESSTSSGYGHDAILERIGTIEFCLYLCDKLVGGKKQTFPMIDWRTPEYPIASRPSCWVETDNEYLSIGNNGILKKIIDASPVNEGGMMYTTSCKYSICTGTRLDKGEVVLTKMVLWTEKGDESNNIVICRVCKDISVPKDCDVSVQSTNTEVTVKMTASRGFYKLAINDREENGIFLGSTIVTFDIPNEGLFRMTGHCNGHYIRRKIVITTNEYCEEKYKGIFSIHSRTYCKEYRLIHRLVVAYLILLVLYFLAYPISILVSALVSIILSALLVVFRKKMICQSCLRVRLPFFHKCRSIICAFCDKQIMDEGRAETYSSSDKELLMISHLDKCPNYVTGGTFSLMIMSFYKCTMKCIFRILKFLPKLSAGVVMLWFLLIMASGKVDAKMTSSEINMILDIYQTVKENLDTSKNMTQRLDCFNQKFSILSKTTYVLITFLVTLLLVWIFTPFVMRRRIHMLEKNGYKICEYCMRAHPLDSNHKCKKVQCINCETYLGFSRDLDVISKVQHFLDVHEQTCFISSWNRRAVENSHIRHVRRWMTKRSSFSLVTGIYIFLIASFLITGADCLGPMDKVVDDLGEFIKDLEVEGFHPYNARFSGNAREKISTIGLNKVCEEKNCRLTQYIEANLVIKDGREYGYNACMDEKKVPRGVQACHQMNIKILTPRVQCSYKELYITGPVSHKSASADTCTKSCQECLSSIKVSQSNRGEVYSYSHKNTASWSCDGPGCMAINQGCTCGKCWCDLDDSAVRVYKKVMEQAMFDLCVQLGSKGVCKTVSREVNSDHLKVLQYGKEPNECPELIAREMGTEIVKSGPINNMGEFDNKFGAVQYINEVLASKREDRYKEHCLFAKHRWVSYDQCCKDTYHLWDYLQIEHMKRIEDGVYVKGAKDLGSWKIKLSVPDVHFMQETDSLTLTDLKITNCKGCFSCNEGGSCDLHYRADFTVNLPFSCEGCRTDIDSIKIENGIKATSFNVYCDKKQGDITCNVKDIKVQGSFHLMDEPLHPHGDGALNVDVTKTMADECEGWLCGMKMPNIFSLGWVKYLLLIIVLILLTIFLVWALVKIFNIFKTITPSRADLGKIA